MISKHIITCQVKWMFILVISFFMNPISGISQEVTGEKPSDGDGTQQYPYQIENISHLRWLSEDVHLFNCYFIQTADIDAVDTKNWNDGSGFYPLEMRRQNLQVIIMGTISVLKVYI